MERAYLGHNIYLVDVFDLFMENRTGSYIIIDEKITVIDTSASPSIPHLLKGLRDLDVATEDIDYIILTHVHLDHAGGVGLFIKDCPNAKVIVHPRGYKHIANPEKLIAGARAVYGNDFDKLYEPVLPVPESRIIAMKSGDQLSISENRKLTFYDSPGHAKHHFSIYDPVSNGIFTGDTIGIYYKMLESLDIELYLPSTTPNHFDPDAMIKSLEHIESLNVDRIYFGHYGMSNNPDLVYAHIRKWLPLFVKAGEDAARQVPSQNLNHITEKTNENLNEFILSFIKDKGIPENHPFFKILDLDLKINAMGIVDYLTKKST